MKQDDTHLNQIVAALLVQSFAVAENVNAWKIIIQGLLVQDLQFVQAEPLFFLKKTSQL